MLLFVLPHIKEPSEFCHFDGLNSKHPLILVSPSAHYAATCLVQREDVLVKFLEKKKMKNEKKECKFLIDFKMKAKAKMPWRETSNCCITDSQLCLL